MHMVQILAVIATILFLAAAPPYLIDTIKGRTKPQRSTWFIWSVLGTVAFIAQRQLGGTWSLVFLGLDTLSTLLIFGLSIKYGVGGWNRSDKIALVIAAVGLAISLVAHRPIVAILGALIADFSGAVLTVRKTFQDPTSETTISWLLVGTGCLCGVLSVGTLNIGLLLYPVYLTLANYSVPITQLLSRYRLGTQTPKS